MGNTRKKIIIGFIIAVIIVISIILTINLALNNKEDSKYNINNANIENQNNENINSNEIPLVKPGIPQMQTPEEGQPNLSNEI